jgi:glutamate/tyrosine decarboxylase-like PLP-dependent enzyme
MINSLKQLIDEIEDFYSNIDQSHVVPDVSPEEIRRHLTFKYNFEKHIPLEDLINDVSKMMRNWNIKTTHPRYFGLFNPAVTIASIIADALVALYNPQLATWSHSPVSNEIEQLTLKFMLSKFNFDPDSSIANFTTGGTEANLSAVIVAITNKFPAYREKGAQGLQSKPLIYISEETHHSFERLVHITGLGQSTLRIVKTDSDMKLDLDDLEEKLLKDRSQEYIPLMIVGTAGTTSSGIIDPLEQLARICQENELWFHVDAAWGGAAILSPRLKHFLKGIELADSITCDAHKWFSVPMGAGMFFCKHKGAVLNAFRVKTSYMPDKVYDTVDPYLATIQWSRRFIGLKVFMNLAELGSDGIANIIEHQTLMGEELRKSLKDREWIIVNDTPLPLICFTHEKIKKGRISTKNILQRLYERKAAWISDTILKSKLHALRACITNFRTQKADVDLLVEELDKIMGKICI